MLMHTRPPGHLVWLAGRFHEVPHGLGAGIAICLIEVPADLDVPHSLVGPGEIERAKRIRDPAERSFLLGSHAVLRSVLADALGKSPAELEFTCDEFGKPRLAGQSLNFNMSRSGSATLIGLSEDAQIGVDIERDVGMTDAGIVAREHLSPREYEHWSRLDPASATQALLQCWVRKEACVKAAGIGLAGRLDQLDVGWSPDRVPMPLTLAHGVSRWTTRVVSLPVPPSVVAAAAVVTGSGQVPAGRPISAA